MLTFNIGECLDDLQIPAITTAIIREDDVSFFCFFLTGLLLMYKLTYYNLFHDEICWNCTAMKCELVDVSV